MMSTKPQPRIKYDFHEMKKGDVKKIHIPDANPVAGERARCAAYAYGRRNNMQFCGSVEVQRKRNYMVICRVK